MANIDGITTKRYDLVGGQVDQVQFNDNDVYVVSLAVMDDASVVAYKVNGVLSAVDDVDSNYLDGSLGVNSVTIVKDFAIKEISVLSTSAAPIQWEVKR